MKRSISLRVFLSCLLVFSMLSPVTVLAGDNGKKYFNQGMKHEYAEEWDKAVEQFALAVAETPKNPEYRLHLTRALFNASQQFMKKGNTAAKEKDYETAYALFRRAYAFDPTNELAKSEMERMVRLQQEINEGATEKAPGKDPAGKVKLVTTGYTPPTTPVAPVSQKLEKLRDLPFPAGVDIQFIIKELARDLDLNVLFDVESFRQAGRKVNIDLKNVSAARALDYIFMQEGLFFQKVGPRTIIVANQQARQKFQQMVLRTFYLANAAPKDIVKVVQTAIPAQPGRSQTIVLPDEATNSVTIRDTSENIRLIGQLIKSLDKDRAEVVMDVAIYEVNKNDLMQFGNQVGTQQQLTNLSGSQTGQVRLGPQGLLSQAVGTAAAAAISSVIPTGILLPSANLAAFQSKNDTRLLAFSQIHAFNNEDSEARIGQRVPVRSASFNTGLNTGGQIGNTGGVVSDVINYEQVGLTLKFKPIVFPNQDVQVGMEIESKDVSGAQTLTPTFTERKIKGTARIQNNKTLLLASVAQGVESKGKQGLPLLGLIPIIGRLFTAPTRDNRQVDIVIAVTPRVIRAPSILPEDEIERATGSMATPTTNTLEELVAEEEREELLAAARRLSNASAVQLPDQPVVDYVKSDAVDVSKTTITDADMVSAKSLEAGIPNLKPIDNSARSLQLTQTSNAVSIPVSTDATVKASEPPVRTLEIKEKADNEPVQSTARPESAAAAPAVELKLGAQLAEMKAGEKLRIPVVVNGDGMFRTATMGLTYDPAKLAVKAVNYGDIFGKLANSVATPFLNDKGRLYVTLTADDEKGYAATGIFAYVEIEVLADGKPEIGFDRDMFNFQTAQGKILNLKFQ